MKPALASLSHPKPHNKSIKMKKSKPLTGAQKRKQKRELQEREEREQKELIADIERLKLGPTDLWKLITDHPDIFETHVLKSGYLNETEIKMFYECCRASRISVIRAKIELLERFRVRELSSISTLELAWEGYPWGERLLYPDGRVDEPGSFLLASRWNKRSQITQMGARRERMCLEVSDEW
jgi:hypothetical protein